MEQAPGWLNAPRTAGSEWRLVAEAEDGQVVGYGHALRDDWMEPGLFWTNIAVAHEARRQGIGSLIHEALLDWARLRGGASLMATVYEHLPQSVRFTERHGYQIERHIFESTLDLSAFDERPLLGALEAAQAAGYRPDCQVVALDGAVWVGLARLDPTEATEAMCNGITRVLPPWRSRGIALALKLLAIRAARRYGARYLRANNDSENAPMLAVNRKLGYQPEPGYYRMRARLAPAEGVAQSLEQA